MPPKVSSKAKRNFSYSNAEDSYKKDNRITITFTLIGDSTIGIEVPYKALNNDYELKKIIKSNQGVWDHEEKLWIVRGMKSYHSLLDCMLDHCKIKKYYCAKIPSYVFDAILDMPLELVVKVGKLQNPPLLRYLSTETYMDPQTLPFYEKLYDFQKQSLLFGIQHHGRMLLADEMGVGKTIQSLAISFMYRYEWPMVVICPSTLRYNWYNQILNWYGDQIKKNEVQIYTKGGSTLRDTTKILIISYDLAWKYKQVWGDFKLAIVDEAHYLKNSGCKRTDILVPELAKRKRVILLTGTPAFARPRQIYNLISIIRPDVFYNFIQFGTRYCDPSRNNFSHQIEYNGCKNSRQLHYVIKNKIMLRRLKKEVLTQLPDKQRQKIMIQTNKAITKQISLLMEQSNNGSKAENMIMQMFGLRGNSSNNVDYQRKRQSLMEAYRLSGTAKVEGVVEYILQLLGGSDVKLLIFAHHRAILDKIEKELHGQKYKTIRIDGEVEMAQRQNRVNEFQSDKSIMAALLSISAAGVGLTLTASSTVVFAELHWTPAMMLQAEDRAHRIGQKACVNCHYLIGEGTLDNILYNYLLKKITNVSTFVDGSEQHLEIQELNKGAIGKISKSTFPNSDEKSKQGQNRNSGKLVITSIRREKQINKTNTNVERLQSESDIQSQVKSNPFNEDNYQNNINIPNIKERLSQQKYQQQILFNNIKRIQNVENDEEQIQTLSLSKSAKKLKAIQLLEMYSPESQIKNHGRIISKNKLRVFSQNVIVSQSKEPSEDSLRTSQLLELLQFDEELKQSIQKSVKSENRKDLQNFTLDSCKNVESIQYADEQAKYKKQNNYNGKNKGNNKKGLSKSSYQEKLQSDSDTDIEGSPAS